MKVDVKGQFVAPQKTATIAHAAQNDGENPISIPKVHPNVAPIDNEGTISPLNIRCVFNWFKQFYFFAN